MKSETFACSVFHQKNFTGTRHLSSTAVYVSNIKYSLPHCRRIWVDQSYQADCWEEQDLEKLHWNGLQ